MCRACKRKFVLLNAKKNTYYNLMEDDARAVHNAANVLHRSSSIEVCAREQPCSARMQLAASTCPR
jgi:hypothetical protein